MVTHVWLTALYARTHKCMPHQLSFCNHLKCASALACAPALACVSCPRCCSMPPLLPPRPPVFCRAATRTASRGVGGPGSALRGADSATMTPGGMSVGTPASVTSNVRKVSCFFLLPANPTLNFQDESPTLQPLRRNLHARLLYSVPTLNPHASSPCSIPKLQTPRSTPTLNPHAAKPTF